MPPHKPPKIRGIFQEDLVGVEFEELGVSPARIDDIIGGLGDTIARRPEVFARDEETGWSRIIVKAFPPEIPFLRVWFTYTETDVYIEHIEQLGEADE
jgi:hypothetical protein